MICFPDQIDPNFRFYGSIRPCLQSPPMPAATLAPLRIGCAAGFSGDRTDAAGPVVDALIAAGGPAVPDLRDARRAHAGAGPAGAPRRSRRRLRAAARRAAAAGARALPRATASASSATSARRIRAARRGASPRSPPSSACAAPRIAVVEGDDLGAAGAAPLLRDALGARRLDGVMRRWSAPTPTSAPRRSPTRCVAGAEIVVTGRVADPSLTVGPALAHFGWAATTGTGSARATMAGHLLECGAQVTGGYFADPGYKDVPDLAHVGYPIAEIDADGHCTITKPPGTGGRIDAHTVKEQLLYEVHDPAAYLTPDVVADISEARVIELGAGPRPRSTACAAIRGPPTLKVNVFREQRLARRGRDLLRRAARRGARAAGRATSCASAWRARAAARRPDRRRQHPRRRRRRAGSPRTPRRRRARRPPARRRRRTTTGGGRAPAARSDRALHLRPGGRRRRAHRAAPAAVDTVSCFVPRDARAGALRDDGAPHDARAPCPLYRAAHGRTGDKGNRSNISVIAWHRRSGRCWSSRSPSARRARSSRTAARAASRATCCRTCRR